MAVMAHLQQTQGLDNIELSLRLTRQIGGNGGGSSRSPRVFENGG
jgi:hypothetical protein